MLFPGFGRFGKNQFKDHFVFFYHRFDISLIKAFLLCATALLCAFSLLCLLGLWLQIYYALWVKIFQQEWRWHHKTKSFLSNRPQSNWQSILFLLWWCTKQNRYSKGKYHVQMHKAWRSVVTLYYHIALP